MNPTYPAWIADPSQIPQARRDRRIPSLGELALFLGGSDDSYTGDLLRLMRKADPGNRRRLASAYPIHDAALVIWETLSPVTWHDLGELLAWIPIRAGVTVDLTDLEESIRAFFSPELARGLIARHNSDRLLAEHLGEMSAERIAQAGQADQLDRQE